MEESDPARVECYNARQRELLRAHELYLTALRQFGDVAASEFVRSREPLIEAMATARDRLLAQADIVRHAERAVS